MGWYGTGMNCYVMEWNEMGQKICPMDKPGITPKRVTSLRHPLDCALQKYLFDYSAIIVLIYRNNKINPDTCFSF